MKKKLMSLIMVMVMAAFLLCGCGAPSTVEEYYSQPAVAAEIDAAMAEALAQQSEYLSACDWHVTGNTIVYEYTYNEGIEGDGSFIQSSLEAQKDEMIGGIKDECGVADPITVEYVYYAADGTVIADVVLAE